MNVESGYGNYQVFSPDNILMFHTNKRRLDFYIRKDLVEEISDKKYRFKFVPNGLGHSGYDRNPLLLIQRENRCVCTGETDLTLLSRHHIVPSVFRRNFPEDKKSSNFLFVVLLNRESHNAYTIEEHKYYNEIAISYDVPLLNETTKQYNNGAKILRIARTLLEQNTKIPLAKFIDLKKRFEDFTGTVNNTAPELMQSLREFEAQQEGYRQSEFDFGKMVVDKITDFAAFEMKWLDHFIRHAKPMYLPDDLQLHYDLYKNKNSE